MFHDTAEPFSSYFDVIIKFGILHPGAYFSKGLVAFRVRRPILKSKPVENLELPIINL